MGKEIARVAVPALLAFVSLFALAASASAEYAHPEATYEFGKEGPKASGTGNGCRLAYQSASKRLYLMADEKVYGLDVSAPGAAVPLAGFPFSVGVRTDCSDPALAVDNTGGGTKNNIYVAPSSHAIHGFSPTGTPLAAPWPVDGGGETCGLAVTSTGEVWGGNYTLGGVSKFAPTGPFISNFAVGYKTCKIAVDTTTNDLYVASYSGGITRYPAPGYEPGPTFPSNNNPGMAINGAKDKLYVASGSSEVLVYDTNSGGKVETINAGGGASGVAVNEADDTVWLTADGAIKEYPGVEVPKATTGDPTANSSVSGTADPDGAGQITECFFEYGTGFANTEPCDQAVPIVTSTPVTATLPSLVGEQANPYRLVLGNANGRARGVEKQITPHNVKGLKTEAATNVTRKTADLHASFEGDGTETFYYFEWGETTGYPLKSALPPGPSIGEPTFPPLTNLGATATNLDPEKTYHFRVVAQNDSGTSPAQDLTFQTLPAVQSLATEAATGVTGHEATLHGSYLADGDQTDYYFEYGAADGPPGVYDTKTDLTPAATAGTPPLSAAISGLALESTYHYRVVATNSLGTTKGGDQSFTTEGAVKGLVTLPATEISLSGVTLNGQFAGNGDATSYWFEYGRTEAYEEVTAPISAGEPVVLTPLPSVISVFEGYSTYHFRVVAENSEGKTFGNDLTFETPDALLPEISAVSADVLGPTDAQLQGQIKPNRWRTVYRIQYGTDTGYGSLTPLSEPIEGDLSNHEVSMNVAGLQPGTTYHMRFVAINFAGTSRGPDLVVTTPAVPRIDSSSVSSVGQTSAHLGALIAGNASPTTIHFEYGTSPSYGSATSPQAVGSSLLGEPVAVDLSGLTPGTTYHARVVATNAVGTASGPDISFRTVDPPARKPVDPKPPRKCRKGFVKKHGKCVKKARKHKGGKRR